MHKGARWVYFELVWPVVYENIFLFLNVKIKFMFIYITKAM